MARGRKRKRKTLPRYAVGKYSTNYYVCKRHRKKKGKTGFGKKWKQALASRKNYEI